MDARSSIVLLAAPCDATRIVFHALARAFEVPAVILEHPISKAQLFVRRARRLGLRRVASQAAFSALIAPILRRASVRRIAEIRTECASSDTELPERLLVRVPTVNSDECVAALRKLEPKVVVVSGTRIIARRVLESVSATFVNTHVGITPRYRGSHGAYWALAEGRPQSAGVTVHVVDPGIDTGSILGQAIIEPTKLDNFATYPYLQLKAALPLLIDAVKSALNDEIRLTPSLDASASRLWYQPTVGEYLVNRLVRGVK